MRRKSGTQREPAERVIKDIRRVTRRRFSAEDKIRIVLEGLRGEESIAALCRREADVEVDVERSRRRARAPGATPDGDPVARLKDEARALYGMVEGHPGVKSPAEWAKRLDQTGDDIGNGRFIVRYLGAERYLDAETVAVLITLRQN